jgi:hypothetical protein
MATKRPHRRLTVNVGQEDAVLLRDYAALLRVPAGDLIKMSAIQVLRLLRSRQAAADDPDAAAAV